MGVLGYGRFIEKLAAACARQPEGSFGIQPQLSGICHAGSPSPLARKQVHQRTHSEDNRCRPSIPSEPTGRSRMTNRFGIYLCQESCRRKEFVGRAIGPVLAIAARRVLPTLLVRRGLRELTHYFLAPWQLSRFPRLESLRLGFEPLC